MDKLREGITEMIEDIDDQMASMRNTLNTGHWGDGLRREYNTLSIIRQKLFDLRKK